MWSICCCCCCIDRWGENHHKGEDSRSSEHQTGCSWPSKRCEFNATRGTCWPRTLQNVQKITELQAGKAVRQPVQQTELSLFKTSKKKSPTCKPEGYQKRISSTYWAIAFQNIQKITKLRAGKAVRRPVQRTELLLFKTSKSYKNRLDILSYRSPKHPEKNHQPPSRNSHQTRTSWMKWAVALQNIQNSLTCKLERLSDKNQFNVLGYCFPKHPKNHRVASRKGCQTTGSTYWAVALQNIQIIQESVRHTELSLSKTSGKKPPTSKPKQPSDKNQLNEMSCCSSKHPKFTDLQAGTAIRQESVQRTGLLLSKTSKKSPSCEPERLSDDRFNVLSCCSSKHPNHTRIG